MSKAFSSQDLGRRVHYAPPSPRSMITQKHPGADRVKVCNLMKKRLQQRCFPVNIAKCLRTAFL